MWRKISIKKDTIIIVLLIVVTLLLGRISYQIDHIDIPNSLEVESKLWDISEKLNDINETLSTISVTRKW